MSCTPPGPRAAPTSLSQVARPSPSVSCPCSPPSILNSVHPHSKPEPEPQGSASAAPPASSLPLPCLSLLLPCEGSCLPCLLPLLHASPRGSKRERTRALATTSHTPRATRHTHTPRAAHGLARGRLTGGTKLFNVFHPTDPFAYRFEPLLDPAFAQFPGPFLLLLPLSLAPAPAGTRLDCASQSMRARARQARRAGGQRATRALRGVAWT
jgi:hypothetical protein